MGAPNCRYLEVSGELFDVFLVLLWFYFLGEVFEMSLYQLVFLVVFPLNPLDIIEERLEVKLPTIWTDEKAEVERVREEKRRRKKLREEKESEERRCRCSKRIMIFWGSGGSKRRLARAAGAEPSGEMRDEKLHAVVAQSTFRSQNVQDTSCLGS